LQRRWYKGSVRIRSPAKYGFPVPCILVSIKPNLCDDSAQKAFNFGVFGRAIRQKRKGRAVLNRARELRRVVLPGLLGLLILGSFIPAFGQAFGPITGATLTASNTLRLVVQPPPTANPDLLLLQSSDSPLGPWWNEPDFQRNSVVGGFE